MKIKEVDLICTSHHLNWNFFSNNLQSWLREIPIGTIYFGNNNPDKKYRDMVKDYLSSYERVEFIDQFGIKTLGMNIADLMKRTSTELFVFCHADVEITPHAWLVMEADMNKKVGIIESERVQYPYENVKSYPTVYSHYHYRERAFSGFQLFRMEAIKDILERIEDDYIYRNEDIIFQNACINAGFEYKKSWAMHVHSNVHTTNHKWTPQGEECEDARAITFEMQVKGIVKYCTPNSLTKNAWRDGFGAYYKETRADLFDFIDNFVMKTNPVWKEAIQDTIMKLIGRVYL